MSHPRLLIANILWSLPPDPETVPPGVSVKNSKFSLRIDSELKFVRRAALPWGSLPFEPPQGSFVPNSLECQDFFHKQLYEISSTCHTIHPFKAGISVPFSIFRAVTITTTHSFCVTLPKPCAVGRDSRAPPQAPGHILSPRIGLFWTFHVNGTRGRFCDGLTRAC